MRGEEVRRNRSVLLARWRGAAAVVRDRNERASPSKALPTGAVEVPPEPLFALAHRDAAESPARPDFAPSGRDELTLLQELEAEIRRAVPSAMAQTLSRLLAAPRAGATELTEEIRAALLSQLDLVEDVLDAVLLAGGQAGHSEKERDPP
jgi:hypothetical protein